MRSALQPTGNSGAAGAPGHLRLAPRRVPGGPLIVFVRWINNALWVTHEP